MMILVACLGYYFTGMTYQKASLGYGMLDAPMYIRNKV
jgi:hypothetical protein